jgi:hypothetical protein|tara:strand:+ start:5488 stop:5697 length:210 start_codon:yes stop_codon:yes gene_type:complete
MAKKENKLLKFINPLDSDKSTIRKIGESLLMGHTAIDLPMKLLGLKDGGRVRGCGIAKRGFGKAMKRKK